MVGSHFILVSLHSSPTFQADGELSLKRQKSHFHAYLCLLISSSNFSLNPLERLKTAKVLLLHTTLEVKKFIQQPNMNYSQVSSESIITIQENKVL